MTSNSLKVHLAANVEGIQTRRDRTLKITIGTQELNPFDAAQVLELNQKQGWVMFSLERMSEEDIPEEKVDFKTDKTHAQRLRAILYLLWQKEGSHGDSESFYRGKMERIIELYKEKL